MHVFLQDQPFPNIQCNDADFESINLTRYYANLHKAYGKNDALGEFYKAVRKHSTYLKII